MSERHTWTDIDSTRMDPGMFFTTGLGVNLLDDIKALADAMWGYDGATRTYGGGPNPHSHDGTNSHLLTLGIDQVINENIADDAVHVAELKLDFGSDSNSGGSGSPGGNITMNEYSHHPTVSGGNITVGFLVSGLGDPGLYCTNTQYGDYGWTAAAEWYYHGASEPQEVWVRYDKVERKILRVWKSEWTPKNGATSPLETIEGDGKDFIVLRFDHLEIKAMMKAHKTWKYKSFMYDLKATDLHYGELSADLKRAILKKAKLRK